MASLHGYLPTRSLSRFISPDTMVPDPADPQSFNRYSYCLNNPLKYVDPSGHDVFINGYNANSLYNAMVNGFYGMAPTQWEIEAINSPEFAAYMKFRQHNADVAGSMETSEIEYSVSSESGQVEDMYITFQELG